MRSGADDALKGKFPRFNNAPSQSAFPRILTLELTAFDYFWKKTSSCIFINFEHLLTNSFMYYLRHLLVFFVPTLLIPKEMQSMKQMMQ